MTTRIWKALVEKIRWADSQVNSIFRFSFIVSIGISTGTCVTSLGRDEWPFIWAMMFACMWHWPFIFILQMKLKKWEDDD